jgi:hypothetical protein
MTPEEGAARRARKEGALQRALKWAHVVQWQLGRLHDAERRALRADEKVRLRYGHDDNRPFFELQAERHFLLIAARQLRRALDRYGDKKKVPAPSHDPAVMIALRNALEHWDDKASELLQPEAYQWGAGGSLIGGVLKADQLGDWALEVEKYLLEVSATSK